MQASEMGQISNSHADSVIVRDFSTTDAERVSSLLRELGYPTTSSQVVDRFEQLAGEGAKILVAEVEGEVAGLLAMRIGRIVEDDRPYCALLALVVGTQWQCRGVGRRLVQTVEDQAARSNCACVVLNSGTSRREAHAFYEQLGYAATGRRFIKQLPDPTDSPPGEQADTPFAPSELRLSDNIVLVRPVGREDLPAIETALNVADIRTAFNVSSARVYLDLYENARREGRGAAFTICTAARCATRARFDPPTRHSADPHSTRPDRARPEKKAAEGA